MCCTVGWHDINLQSPLSIVLNIPHVSQDGIWMIFSAMPVTKRWIDSQVVCYYYVVITYRKQYKRVHHSRAGPPMRRAINSADCAFEGCPWWDICGGII
jgi:hypothetical protein